MNVFKKTKNEIKLFKGMSLRNEIKDTESSFAFVIGPLHYSDKIVASLLSLKKKVNGNGFVGRRCNVGANVTRSAPITVK